jgi:hypothetical protein
MSKKHNQRTRAEILAKCQVDPQTWVDPVRKASRSKYKPHIGEKQQAKLRRALMLAA